MNPSQPHQPVSDRTVRGLGDRRRDRRIHLPAQDPLGMVPGSRDEAGPTNVLVVAVDVVVPAGLAHAQILVVAPALNSWLRHWMSDEDPARRRAAERVAGLVDRLERTALHVEGRVADADPLQAIADALPTFPADAVVIAALPGRATRQVEDLVSRARERFALPVFRAGESRPIAA
jgi:hypothetical protein